MVRAKTGRYDPVNDLETEEDVIGYLEAALGDGDPAVIAAALDDILRAGHVHDGPEGRPAVEEEPPLPSDPIKR